MTRNDFSFVMTAHARKVISERAIRLEWIERVLGRPERTAKDQEDPELHHALGRIPEHGGRYCVLCITEWPHLGGLLLSILTARKRTNYESAF